MYLFEQLQFDAILEDCIIKSFIKALCLILQVCPKPFIDSFYTAFSNN